MSLELKPWMQRSKPLNRSPCSGSVARKAFFFRSEISGGSCNKETQRYQKDGYERLDVEEKEVGELDGDAERSSWKPKWRWNSSKCLEGWRWKEEEEEAWKKKEREGGVERELQTTQTYKLRTSQTSQKSFSKFHSSTDSIT